MLMILSKIRTITYRMYVALANWGQNNIFSSLYLYFSRQGRLVLDSNDKGIEV